MKLGPIVLGFVVQALGWRWNQYVTLMIILLALISTIGMPETFQREIPRRINKRRGLPPPVQPPAGSGVTFGEMARITVINPVIGFFTDPVIFMTALYLGFNFAVVFQWFITVPVVLTGPSDTIPPMGFGLSLGSAGIAFTSAIIGTVVAAVIGIAIEQFFYRRSLKSNKAGSTRIELRLIPAMYGGFLIMGSLFWIAWTASPAFNVLVPVAGTGVYVWGNVAVVVCDPQTPTIMIY